MSDSATEYDKLFIGGKWTKPSTSDVIEVRCPATGEYVGKVPMAAAADVDAAVAARSCGGVEGQGPLSNAARACGGDRCGGQDAG